MSNQKNIRAALGYDQLAAFCRDTAMLLEANIPLHLGYADIYGFAAENAPLRRAAEALCPALEQTGRLSEAMRQSSLFPDHLCDMAAIGERTGRLDEMMRELSVYYDRLDNFQRRVKNAVLYPVVLLCMMAVVVGVLIWAVLPVFENVLGRFNTSAQADAGAVMQGSLLVCTIVFALLVLALAAAAALLLMSRSAKGAQLLRRFFETFPPSRRLGYNVAVSHFASGLSAMLQSGFSTEESLRALLPSISHSVLRARVQSACEALQKGTPQADALINAKLFTDSDNHLIAVSARTGAMDSAASGIARRYDAVVADALDQVVAVAEPALIACLTVVIGAVMLSVMIPLIRIMGSLG